MYQLDWQARWMMFWVAFGLFSVAEVFADILFAFWSVWQSLFFASSHSRQIPVLLRRRSHSHSFAIPLEYKNQTIAFEEHKLIMYFKEREFSALSFRISHVLVDPKEKRQFLTIITIF